MNYPLPPRSPLTTQLSGSAKEIELRIRGIFQSKKKKPPVWLVVLILTACLLCGSLVSCQTAQSLPDPDQLAALLSEQSSHPEAAQATPTLLAQISQDGYILAAVSVSSEPSSGYQLVFGVIEEQTGSLVGPVYLAAASGAQPHCIAITRYDGSPALLYTCNGFQQGLSFGEAGLVALDRGSMAWSWPVEGDIRVQDSSVKADYDTFWQSNHALLAPGGVDVFARTDYAVISGDGPQWTADHNELFYPTSEPELPIGVMYQCRVWLEEFTRQQNNPFNLNNASALWSIQSVTPYNFTDPNQMDHKSVYTLLARADTDDTLYFAAHLLYDGDTGTISNAYGSAMGTLDEVTGRMLENQSGSQQRDELILAYYQHTYPAQPIYWLTQGPAQPQEGDWRLDSVTYAGEALLYETTGVAFWVQQSLYSSSQWAPFQPSLIVLSQGQDGSFQSVLGQSNTSLFLEGMTIEDIIRQTAWHLLDVEVCLYRDGYPNPIGPGNWYDLFRVAYEGEPNIQLLEDYTPIYYPGDYWDRWTLEGFSALRYYSAAEDCFSLNTLDVTRDDLYTPRGIRVGATRAEVLAAYPEASSEDYWGLYSGQDYLWYCNNPIGYGAAILFFFQGDTLTQITLQDMFD